MNKTIEGPIMVLNNPSGAVRKYQPLADLR